MADARHGLAGAHFVWRWRMGGSLRAWCNQNQGGMLAEWAGPGLVSGTRGLCVLLLSSLESRSSLRRYGATDGSVFRFGLGRWTLLELFVYRSLDDGIALAGTQPGNIRRERTVDGLDGARFFPVHDMQRRRRVRPQSDAVVWPDAVHTPRGLLVATLEAARNNAVHLSE